METKNEIDKKEEMNNMNNNKNMFEKLQEMIKLSDADLKKISFLKMRRISMCAIQLENI